MYRVIAIVPRGEGTGFSLAGIQVREAVTAVDAQGVLTEEMDNERTGLILIDEAFARDYPAKLQKRIDKSSIPLVVAIPVITQWEYVHESGGVFENIIRRAVGYRIKFDG